MLRRPKLLHVITGLNVGGAERALYTLLSGGLAKALDCHVVSLTNDGYYRPLICEIGVQVDSLGMPVGRPTVSSMGRLVKIVRRVRPHIIQGWMYHGNLAGVFSRRLAPGKPALVWNIRHSLYDLGAERLGTQCVIRVSRRLSEGMEGIIYNSAISRAQHEAFGFHADKGVVIPNGFDLACWRPDPVDRQAVRSTLGLCSGDLLLGYVGRFHTMKDIPTLLMALRRVMESMANLHVVMIGRETGPDNPVLAPSIRELPMERLHFLGQRHDIPFLLRGLDLHCLCSAWGEGFPNVIAEAMASGVPSVTTDVGDARLIVGDTGFVVTPSDPPALASALIAALSESREQRHVRGVKSRQRIEENFSLSSTVAAYRATYEALVSGGAGCAA